MNLRGDHFLPRRRLFHARILPVRRKENPRTDPGPRGAERMRAHLPGRLKQRTARAVPARCQPCPACTRRPPTRRGCPNSATPNSATSPMSYPRITRIRKPVCRGPTGILRREPGSGRQIGKYIGFSALPAGDWRSEQSRSAKRNSGKKQRKEKARPISGARQKEFLRTPVARLRARGRLE
jgi:hypothetical protein